MKLRTLFLTLIALAALVFTTGCGPDYPKCDTDDDCASSEKGQAEGNLFCLNGLCQQCREDAHCGDPGLECNAGVCEQIPGYCTSESDCPGKQKCRNNQCGAECQDNSECPDGTECQGGSCVAKAECSSDGDCPNGQICEGGKCIAASGDCNVDTIYFGYDDASVDTSARSVLQSNADCIKKRGLKVQIAGHCDERGTSEYNIALGERRARNTVKYLQSLGVEKGSMSTISYGEEQLSRECGEEGPESCHRANRRVEFK